jgi:hypothetical protein
MPGALFDHTLEIFDLQSFTFHLLPSTFHLLSIRIKTYVDGRKKKPPKMEGGNQTTSGALERSK